MHFSTISPLIFDPGKQIVTPDTSSYGIGIPRPSPLLSWAYRERTRIVEMLLRGLARCRVLGLGMRIHGARDGGGSDLSVCGGGTVDLLSG